MNKRFLTSLLSLLFLLMMTIGSLQPKTAFACAMMDAIMLDECCCDNHEIAKDCVDSSCNGMLEVKQSPCCERTTEVGINEDNIQNSPVVKPTEIRSDVDPPQANTDFFFERFTSQNSPTAFVIHPQPNTGFSGANTYLITQRLRI